jgi:myo-inositol 2-dehydrogenase/D-chiro-inositol 1-dehydrogenase
VQLRHANGCLTVIDNSRQAVYGFDQRVEAFGSAGAAMSENPLAHTGVLRTADGSRTARLPHFFVERYTQSFLDEWAAFGTALRGGGPPEVGGADGRAPLVIGLAAWRSLREHRPVTVTEIDAP